MIEKCSKCGKPRFQCRCPACECVIPLEEEADGELEEVKIPEPEKQDARKRKITEEKKEEEEEKKPR